MATDNRTHHGGKASADAGQSRTGQQAQQDAAEQRQDEALEQHRANPSAQEAQVRREQGGHDRPVGPDHKPHPRPQPKGGRQAGDGGPP